MTKEEFIKEYSLLLNLSNKKYKFVEKGNKSNFKVGISEYQEIDMDFLYYYYVGNIWEVNLNQKLGINTTLKQNIQKVFKEKKSFEEIDFILLKNRSNNMVNIPLDKFGKQITTTTKQELPTIIEKEKNVKDVFEGLNKLYEYKNKVYGNSALEPLDIFSKIHPYGSRIDEKLARMKNIDLLDDKAIKNILADIIVGLGIICKDKQYFDFLDILE